MDERILTRAAHSGEGEIGSRLWVGGNTAAVLQIAHGMAEHGARYAQFAEMLVERGFAVCANDHAGHGLSAVTKGFFAEEDGYVHALFDMKALTDEMRAMFPGAPLFLLGHSMGSFLSRAYITRWGEDLRGCVLSGTAGRRAGLSAGKAVAAALKGLGRGKKPSKLLDRLVNGGNNKRVENPKSPVAWLTRDEEMVRGYEEDPDCGFLFTASGYHDLFSVLDEVTQPDWAAKVPVGLPVYVLSGDADPVGDYGNGPREVYEALKATGHDVTLKLYEGGRHEMLNETNREEVYEDTIAWLVGRLR